MFGNAKTWPAAAIAAGLAALAVPPGQPARTLSPDALDAPAASSVLDAQRSAEMAEGMAGGGGHGGHGGHGKSAYRHVDAGRAAAGAEPHHHHGEAPPEAAAVYVCPMHPEVTGGSPGECPKCGMALVPRRKE